MDLILILFLFLLIVSDSDIKSGKRKSNKLYGVILKAKDMVQKKDGTPLTDSADYYAHADKYESIFATKVMPYVTFLANCMYWDFHFPRLITKKEIKDLRATGNKNLKFISDISCDVGGSVEFLSKCTNIEQPFYNYLPETDTDLDNGLSAEGIGILSVEILPTELPRDASEHFGNALMPLIPPLVTPPAGGSSASAGSSLQDKQLGALSTLPKELQRACIASHGQLLPKWKYINRLRESNNLTEGSGNSDGLAILNISGHLFDSGLINNVLDELESFKDKIKFSLTNCDVRPNMSSTPVPSHIEIHVEGSKEDVKEVCDHVTSLIDNFHESADATVYTAHSSEIADSATPATKSAAEIRVTSPKRVLLLGSGNAMYFAKHFDFCHLFFSSFVLPGRVCAPVIKLLGTHDNIHITVASDSESQSRELLSMLPPSRGSFAPLIMGSNGEGSDMVSKLVRGSDLVISLLPATMHMQVAEAAIAHKKHMVTASYVSEAMRGINQDAINAGISIVNEVGLDPGIDHMMIMKSIDDIHERGGKITELVSLCGGLPDPVAGKSVDGPPTHYTLCTTFIYLSNFLLFQLTIRSGTSSPGLPREFCPPPKILRDISSMARLLR